MRIALVGMTIPGKENEPSSRLVFSGFSFGLEILRCRGGMR